jgi:hypothetical protein
MATAASWPRGRTPFRVQVSGDVWGMALLRLLRFSPVRAVLIWLVRSPLGRRTLRATVRAVGRKRILDLAWKAIKL